MMFEMNWNPVLLRINVNLFSKQTGLKNAIS